MNRVAAIIVCFFPDLEKLRVLIEVIEPSVCEILLFNNGGLNEVELNCENPKIKVKSLGSNVGIGAALNAGCDLALANGSRFAVTFDQDSTPEKNMIPILIQEFLSYQVHTPRVAAIGPQLVDIRGKSEIVFPFVQFTSLGYKEWRGAGTQSVSHVVTSGCLIDLNVWCDGNSFDERLFIDLVDNNWCWQLIKNGYFVLGTSKAKMTHEISDEIKKVNRYSLNTYRPMRRYFQIRNVIYHLCYVKLSLAQKKYLLRSFAVTSSSALFSDTNPMLSFLQCLRGFVHGLTKKLGPYPG
jgi:rhamnosyltransferase